MPIKLSQNFSLDEFLVSDTAKNLDIDNSPTSHIHLRNLILLADGLEKIRKEILGPIRISSGYRSPALNKAVDGVGNSDHALGLAADFSHGTLSTPVLFDYIKLMSLEYDQLINEFDKWIHISFNPRMRHDNLIAYKNNGKTEYKQG